MVTSPFPLFRPLGQTFPLGVSDDGRYLIYQDGTAFLLVGDSPQGLMYLSLVDMETYLSDRASKGFNTIQVHLLCGETFGGGTNGATYDGITPFLTPNDLSTPREAYFARVDAMLALAADYGFCVHLTAAETIDWASIMKSNGTTVCRAFGNYLGNRYKNNPNIIWNYGNDFQTWESDQDLLDCVLAICDGIIDYDSNHLHTAWLDYFVSSTRDSSDFNSRCALNLCYWYYVAYDGIEAEYVLDPAKPVFLGETGYEGETIVGDGNPDTIRRQNYWSLTSGGCGVVFCNTYIWNFKTDWDQNLDTIGANDITRLISLFSSVDWWKLVPDIAGNTLTAGRGDKETGSIAPNDSTYATCALASDGSFIIAFLPTSREVTIDMSKITTSENALCRWFNPQTGEFSVIGTYSTSGTRNFTPSAGDWCLLIEAV